MEQLLNLCLTFLIQCDKLICSTACHFSINVCFNQIISFLFFYLFPAPFQNFITLIQSLNSFSPNQSTSSLKLANLLVLGGGYDSLPRRSALYRQTSAGSTTAGNSCIGSCAKVVAECEKKVKLLEEILRLQDEALQAGKQQKALAAARSFNSAIASPTARDVSPASSTKGVSVS